MTSTTSSRKGPVSDADVVADAGTQSSEAAVSGFADPAGEAPWAMQFVARVEKATPPRHTDVVEACARATVLLLDEVARGGDEQARARVQRWTDGRIRKVVRRARGAAWEAASQFATGGEGIVLSHGSAEVAVYLPGPTNTVPHVLRKLQVAGLELSDDGDPVEVMPPQEVRILLNPDLALSTGKTAAQVSHAAQVLWMTLGDAAHEQWVRRGAPLTAVTATPQGWERATQDAPVHIRDAGFTEIPAGSQTCVALTDLALSTANLPV